MNTVTIFNSWILDQCRNIRYPNDVKHYYFDRIVSSVFKQADINVPLEIYFQDNHFSNIEYLDYKELHKVLLKYFPSVKFYSDNSIDHLLAPDYFEFCISPGLYSDMSFFLHNSFNEDNAVSWHDNKKMFGIAFTRPDIHRFSILAEFKNRNLFPYANCKIGFDRSDLIADEHWRSSAIDLACKTMNISHTEMLDLVDYIPKSDDRLHRNNSKFFSNSVNPRPVLKLNIDKNKSNNDYVIEVVLSSAITDNIFANSEKDERAITLKQPFIIVGSQHFYRRLHAMGFQTFSKFWDESWDDLPFNKLEEKMLRIGKTCEDIVKNYTNKDIFDITRDIVEHNYKVMKDLAYTTREEQTQLYKRCFRNTI